MGALSIEEKIEEVRQFEQELGVAAGFFENLLKEDDWTFVIKLHALIEASATSLLVEIFDKPELKKQFGSLPLSDVSYGKLSFLKSLGVIEKPYEHFVRKLSEIRNKSVHNVSQTSLDFRELVDSSDKNQKKALAVALGAAFSSGDLEKAGLINDDPKLLIWMTALNLIGQMSMHKRIVSIEKREVDLAVDALDILIGEKGE